MSPIWIRPPGIANWPQPIHWPKVKRSANHVVINPVTPNLAPRRFLLGTVPPSRSDGLGGWQEVPRERNTALPEYTGASVPKVDITVLLDGWPDTSVQRDIDWLMNLGRRDGTQTPVFTVVGPVYLSGQKLVIGTGIDFGQFERRSRDGALVRQELTLHCWKYRTADVLTSSSAKKRKKHDGGGKQSHPKTYTVRKGDTLSKIAAKVYGKASDWHRIADANGIRDPRHIKVGQVLKLP